MGVRFRKSIKVAPGVKLNINKKSVGLTVGTKGAHYTVNSKGKKTASVGLPGTGLSYTTSSGGGSDSKPEHITSSGGGSGSKPEHITSKINIQEAPDSTKNKNVTLLLCIFLGGFGIHRFYSGKIGTGILWLLTCGCFIFGWIYDIFSIATGCFVDGNGCVIR